MIPHTPPAVNRKRRTYWTTQRGCPSLPSLRDRVIFHGGRVRLSNGKEIGRANHQILMAPGADVFAVEGIDSSWIRLVAIDEL